MVIKANKRRHDLFLSDWLTGTITQIDVIKANKIGHDLLCQIGGQAQYQGLVNSVPSSENLSLLFLVGMAYFSRFDEMLCTSSPYVQYNDFDFLGKLHRKLFEAKMTFC